MKFCSSVLPQPLPRSLGTEPPTPLTSPLSAGQSTRPRHYLLLLMRPSFIYGTICFQLGLSLGCYARGNTAAPHRAPHVC